MPLDDLNKQIYGSHEDNFSNRAHEKSGYDPVLGVTEKASPFDQDQQWNKPQEGLSPSQKRKIWIGVSIFFFLVLSTGGIIFYKWWVKNAFHQDRVSLKFEGSKEADSTKVMKYVIHYSNNNRVTLKNAEIQLNYSENFQPSDNLNLKYLSSTSSKIFIGDIKPMSQGSADLNGVFYAPRDFPVYLSGQMHFVPSNGTNEIFVDDKIGVSITASPVVLEVDAPRQAVDGDILEYVINYQNRDVRSIGNVQMRVAFPVGFQISNSQPRASEKDNVWYLGNLESNQKGEIRVRGQMKGSDNDGKTITVSLGHLGSGDKFVAYDKRELTTRIVSPVLAVTQKLLDKANNIVTAGEILKYSVAFQNNGDVGLRDAIITVEIKGDILDFSKISAEKGFYDASKNIIIWKASDVPGLVNVNPKASGTVGFTVPVKAVIPVGSRLDKNFVISSVAKIDSPDIPTPIDSNKIIGSNTLELKLASKVLFGTKGYYNDAKIKNSGPIPMETGKETTFSLHWSVINISNDITEVKVASSLPAGVRWTGTVFPANEKITYNQRTNQIFWDAGKVLAGSGAILPAREVVFQVGVTPQTNQIGSSINLINNATLTASDSFTGLGISMDGEAKSTSLSEDPFVGFANGKVAK